MACVVFILALILDGCDMKKQENKNVSNQKITQEEKTTTTENPEIKRKEKVAQVTSNDYSQVSDKPYAWFFCRNKEHQPSGTGEQDGISINQYDGYYVNNKTTDKVVYFTFDCGYKNGYTSKILDTLKEYEATAAFFVTKGFVKDQPELIKQMKAEGHIVANHTMSHPSLAQCSVEEIVQELDGLAEYLKEQTGLEIDPFIRPPKGEYSERSLKVCQDLGYTTVFWSMAYLDYDVNNQPGKDHVVEMFQKYYHPGMITLTHNVSSSNEEALPEVLQNLKKEGYRFGSLWELR